MMFRGLTIDQSRKISLDLKNLSNTLKEGIVNGYCYFHPILTQHLTQN